MDETIIMELLRGVDRYSVNVHLFEDEDAEFVTISLYYNNRLYQGKDESFFEALVQLRSMLEKDGMLLVCNGSYKNVYPSPMMLRMGTGRMAYVLTLGQQAKMADVVDIFENTVKGDLCSVSEQCMYYREWLHSL